MSHLSAANNVSTDAELLLNQTRWELFNAIIYYVNPAIYILILIFGVAWNGTLIIFFIRHKEIRTTANSMILNLVICDILNLIINVPSLCIFHYPHSHPEDVPLCRFYTGARQFLRCVCAMSLVALSIQRFRITARNPAQGNRRTTTWNFIYLFIIWGISLCISLPTVFIWGVYSHLCSTSDDSYPTAVMVMANAVFYCVLLPAVMFTFSFLTARRLRQSCKDIPGELEHRGRVQVRNRSALVVTSLAILFVVSHVPYELWTVAAYWCKMERFSVVIFTWEYISKYLLFLDACFNPVALYIGSRTFRRLFRSYLCCSGSKRFVQISPKAPVERQQSQLSQLSEMSEISHSEDRQA